MEQQAIAKRNPKSLNHKNVNLGSLCRDLLAILDTNTARWGREEEEEEGEEEGEEERKEKGKEEKKGGRGVR